MESRCSSVCCEAGHVNVEGRCCPSGSTWSGNQCCPSGMRNTANGCCTGGLVPAGSICCTPGQVNSLGNCCPSGTAWTSANGQGECCSANHVWTTHVPAKCCPNAQASSDLVKCCPDAGEVHMVPGGNAKAASGTPQCQVLRPRPLQRGRDVLYAFHGHQHSWPMLSAGTAVQ
jgi:hypothetical protein